MLLGVPTFAVIYYIIQMVINGRLHRKNLPEASEFYDEFSFVDDGGKYMISRETLERKQRQTEEETEGDEPSKSDNI